MRKLGLFSLPAVGVFVGGSLSTAVVDRDYLITVPLHTYNSSSSSSSSTIYGTIDGGDAPRRLAHAGIGYGTHFVTVSVGDGIGEEDKSQERILAVSTGSDYTAFPCVGCDGCELTGSPHDPYDFTTSKTYEAVECGYCVGEGVCDDRRTSCVVSSPASRDLSSWEAFEAREQVSIGRRRRSGLSSSGNAFELLFACQTKVRGWYLRDVADGVLGMSASPTSFVSQMHAAGKLPNPAFSLCFGRTGAEGQNHPGALTLGGYNPAFHQTPVVFAQNLATGRFGSHGYHVSIRQLYLRVGGGRSVEPDVAGMQLVSVNYDPSSFGSSRNGLVASIESGEPYTHLPRDLEAPFREAWLRAVGTAYDPSPVTLTTLELRSLPTLLIQLKGWAFTDQHLRQHGQTPEDLPGLAGDLDPQFPMDVVLAVPAAHYLEYNAATGHYRPRMSFDVDADFDSSSSSSSFSSTSVLGANFMAGHDMVFDLTAFGRIGFAEVGRGCQIPRPGSGENDDDQRLPTDDDMFTMNGGGWNLGDDDAFLKANGSHQPKGLDRDQPATRCHTMTCRSFLGLSYVAVLVAGYVTYHCVRMKKGEEQFLVVEGCNSDEIRDLQDIDFPDYEPEDVSVESGPLPGGSA